MTDVRFVNPRDTIEIYLTDNRVLQAKRNASLEEIFQILPEWKNPPIVGAIVNGQLRELTYPVKMDAEVKTLNMADVDGARIYRRSLTFLLEAAFQDIYPQAKVTIDHAVASGGFYCQVDGMDDFTEENVMRLENHMRDIVKADKKFERKEVPLSEAIEYFKQKHFDKLANYSNYLILTLQYRNIKITVHFLATSPPVPPCTPARLQRRHHIKRGGYPPL